MTQLRLLPILIILCSLLLASKIQDIASYFSNDATQISEIQLITGTPQAIAQEKEESTEEESTDKQNTETEEGNGNENITDTPPEETAEDDLKFSQSELKILESLSERRQKLETWEQAIQLKEKVLQATETRISAKVEELKKLQEDVKLLLDQYNEKENAKIARLVKIYESMKPKDAARIFEELEMPVILKVMTTMKEARTAAILAKMNPVRAKEITTEISKQRQMKLTPY